MIVIQIIDYRSALTRAEEKSSRREENLRQEMNDYQVHLACCRLTPAIFCMSGMVATLTPLLFLHDIFFRSDCSMLRTENTSSRNIWHRFVQAYTYGTRTAGLDIGGV